MGADERILVAVVVLLVYAASTVLADATRCSYMEDIPREPMPDDLPAIEWNDSWDWNQRPFREVPAREELCMDEYSHSEVMNIGTQVVFMEEEIEDEIAIVKLNYHGVEIPVIGGNEEGRLPLLGPVVRQNEDGEWYLYITEKQDYEVASMRSYRFDVTIEGQTLIGRISLVLVNIDDNDPIIQIGSCSVTEQGELGLSDCTYEVRDADGRISTDAMTFRIDSTRTADVETFYMQGHDISADWMMMYMTLGMNRNLNFAENALHVFQVTASDSKPNNHTVTLMVQVENVESRPPRWLEIFAVEQFDEKTAMTFTVRAIDGDTGIDKPIHYRLEKSELDTFFRIENISDGHSGAIFHVDPIDRDELERDLFQVTIVAYKYPDVGDPDPDFTTRAEVVIIVNDVNDQIPEPLYEEYYVTIPEETATTLEFDNEFGFHDKDVGAHAQYTVHLESVSPPGAAEAFYIAPTVGYQRQTFFMGTINHTMLDYENPPFQNIILKVVATDTDKPDFIGEAMLHINLENWNDELPIFENNIQTVTFDETVGAGFLVGEILATDRDIGDTVEHSLMGNAANFLNIDIDTGRIYVAIDNAFDYHRQNELFIQIRADDTFVAPTTHTTTTQLVIHLNDINNTPPSLRLPRDRLSKEENVPEGTEITRAISATDPDTTAHLQFEIDWDTSYATKQGRETNSTEYEGCVEIETIFPDEDNTGYAYGRLVVMEIRDNVTLDFEEFEILYLTVRVKDLNQIEDTDDIDEATLAITIIDLNDNAPMWEGDTLTPANYFRIRETSEANTVIGSVLATDIDGPLYNRVKYSIKPRENTADGLVKIDFDTGLITVDEDGAIDADYPPHIGTHNLYYTVIATDRCFDEECPDDPAYWETPGDITIQIIDTNNKVPYSDETVVEEIIWIYENETSGYEIVKLLADDLDRDETFHTVRFQIYSSHGNDRARIFFAVDLETGQVIVNFTTNEVLDRDRGETEHTITITLLDNYEDSDVHRNQNQTQVRVGLLDVNDNAPVLPEPDALSWEISEGLTEGERISPYIYAPDADKEDTDYSRVGYGILDLTIMDREIEVGELFRMIQIENITGELETAMDLKGFWGTYQIHIEAYDHGQPPMKDDKVYQMVILPYNFHAPEFVFPRDGTTVRCSRERAVANGLLATVDNEFLDRIEATDEDGLDAGIVTFEVAGNADATNFFHVVNDGENLGSLMLTEVFPEDIREFQVIIRATDGGTNNPGPLSTDTTLTVIFVPTLGDPIFDITTSQTAFFEQEAGLSERMQLPVAHDPKNYGCVDDCLNIYYRIIDGNEEGHFGLEASTNIIFLEKMLDRGESTSHTLVIAASNSLTPGTPLPGATLTVIIAVREVDARPRFDRSEYSAGISSTDDVGREIMTFLATHSEGEIIRYTIDNDTIVVTHPSLESRKDEAFQLQSTTGVLILNMQPIDGMDGMYQFDVVATDPENLTDRTEVKIYLITQSNRVYMIFMNTVEQVDTRENRDFIAQTFGAEFNMTCNIDAVLRATSGAVALDTVTEVRAHFVQDNEPVHNTVIEELRRNSEMIRRVQDTLSVALLTLQDFRTHISPGASADATEITMYVLAGLCAILGFLCLVLLLTVILRTRAMNRRLEALTVVDKFGSMDSRLNRAGLATHLPGANKHAVETNPIWNESIKAPDFDALSEDSGDSDLIGIEDLPQFRTDYFPPGDDDSTQGIVNDETLRVADHSNNFGFDTSSSFNYSPNVFNNRFQR